MHEGGAEEARACTDHFREWLRQGMSGCRFAATFAARSSPQRITYYTRLGFPSVEEVGAIDRLVEESAENERFFVALFPRLRTPSDIATLLRTLSLGDRWQCERIQWRNHARSGEALIGLTWRTAQARLSSVMGFAPLGTMPVTRRSPYVALALWPGDYVNPHRKGKATPPAIGLVDGAHGLTPEAHDINWDNTKSAVRSLLAEPPEDAPHLRRVAFCLPNVAADAVWHERS